MKIWNSFLDQLEERLGKDTVDKWLRSLDVVRFDARNLYLEARDSFQVAWFEQHVGSTTSPPLLNENGKPIKVHLAMASPLPKQKTEKKKEVPAWQGIFPDPLDPLSTLEKFIFDPKNELLSKSICSQLSFNPFYIHGNRGVGKTHLLMAKAQSLSKNGLRTFFVHAQTFTEHVVNAIRSGNMPSFRSIYRNIDALFLDDVHLLAGKAATQEEFFHLFNFLHSAGKQIFLSAKYPPAELTNMEPRLLSRFEWGLVLPLESLQEEGLKELINTRSQALGFPLSQEAVHYLLETFQHQNASMQKAIDALVLRAHLSSRKISSTELKAREIADYLSDLIEKEKTEVLSPEKIIKAVAEYYGIRPDDILGKSQNQDAVLPRKMAMHLCRMQLKMPFIKIGTFFNRDHSTVMSSIKSVQKKIEAQEQETAFSLTAIQKRL